MRALTAQEKEQVRADYLREVQGGAVAVAELLVEERVARAARDAELLATQGVGGAAADEEYCMEFGAMRRKTIGEVLQTRTQDQAGRMKLGGREYLAFCITSGLQVRYPRFELALKRKGLWDGLQAEDFSPGTEDGTARLGQESRGR
jgi:hypothetical protein